MRGRIRTVKPELFLHEDLFDAEQETTLPLRLAFIGLFTQCDRDGRFKWKQRRLKAAIMPYDTDVDFSAVLDALADVGLIERYEVGGQIYGCIPTWSRHQSINGREAGSEIPPPVSHASSTRQPRVEHTSVTRDSPVSHASSTRASHDTGVHVGKGREGKGTTTRACAREGGGDEGPPDGLREVIGAWCSATGTLDYRLSSMTTQTLSRLVQAHGAPVVTQAITEGHGSNSKTSMSLNYVQKICERIASGAPKPGAGYASGGSYTVPADPTIAATLVTAPDPVGGC